MINEHVFSPVPDTIILCTRYIISFNLHLRNDDVIVSVFYWWEHWWLGKLGARSVTGKAWVTKTKTCFLKHWTVLPLAGIATLTALREGPSCCNTGMTWKPGLMRSGGCRQGMLLQGSLAGAWEGTEWDWPPYHLQWGQGPCFESYQVPGKPTQRRRQCNFFCFIEANKTIIPFCLLN